MKKILSIVLVVLMVLSLNATAFALEPAEYRFSATVITCRYVEATDKYAFCAVGDVYMNGNRDPFTFGISRENIIIAEGLDLAIADGLAMGQNISVIFNGEVMESYPMQIVPNRIIVEEETEEFAEDEVLQYLSMFYTEEWLIENGYMEVPPAEGEAVAPEIDCDEDTTPPSENTQWEEGDLSEDDTPSDEDLLICGVPLEGDEDGECILLTNHYISGYVVSTEFSVPAVEPGGEEGPMEAYIYFVAYDNFGDEMITPVALHVYEDSVAVEGKKLWEIKEGDILTVYCSENAYCVKDESVTRHNGLILDGDIYTIVYEKTMDTVDEHAQAYFWDMSFEPQCNEVEHNLMPADTEINEVYGGEDCVTPDDLDPEYKAADDKTVEAAPVVEKTSEAKVIAIIIACIAVIAAAIIAGVKLVKKK